MQRIFKISPSLIIAIFEEVFDFQFIIERIEKLKNKFNCETGKEITNPEFLRNYLRNLMYKKRRNVDPLYNEIIAGYY